MLSQSPIPTRLAATSSGLLRWPCWRRLLVNESVSRHSLANHKHQSARAVAQRSTRPTSPPVEHPSKLLALPGCALHLTPAPAGPPHSTQVESLDAAEAESDQGLSTAAFRYLTDSSHTIPMVCSIEDSSSRVHYAEVALDDKATLQEPKRQPVTVVDMRNSGLAEVNQLSEQQATAASKNSIWLLAYCCIGIMISFTLNGVVLEKITTHRVLGELSMTFVFCVFNSVVAIGLSRARKEKPSTMPQSFLAIVGALAFGSTIASMVALRYVTYITRILGKSCKSIPVMIMGVLLGKKYALKKYVSVIVLCIGVAVFLLGTAHEKQHRAVQHNDSHNNLPEQERTPNMVLGFSLLVLSLIFDGATGALEDKFMEAYHIGAFDLMYYVNIYKALFSAVGMVVNGEVPVFLEYVIPSLPNLMMLSLTGAFGQAFIFFTISKFGALTTAIIGTCRKVLSIVLSVVLFGHVLSLEQTVGLGLSFVGIGLNWVKMQNCFSKSTPVPTAAAEPTELDALSKEGLLESSSDDTADSESDEQDVTSIHGDDGDEAVSAETARKLELVNAWHRQTTREGDASSNDEKVDDDIDVPAQVV